MTRTAKLRFRDGREESMVSELRATIGDKTGTFVVVANPVKKIKPNTDYQCELIEMKSGKGFIVTDAKEIKDEVQIRIEELFVSLFVKPFGMTDFEVEPRLVYSCIGNVSIKQTVDVLRNRAGYRRLHTLELSHTALKELADDFEAKCKFVRSGSMDGVILDEPLCRLEDEDVNVYLRRSYEKEFSLVPIATYDAREMSWEAVLSELDSMFTDGRIIMPSDDFDAFLSGFRDLCWKREREYMKEVKANFKKGTTFTKSVKIVDGEYVS